MWPGPVSSLVSYSRLVIVVLPFLPWVGVGRPLFVRPKAVRSLVRSLLHLPSFLLGLGEGRDGGLLSPLALDSPTLPALDEGLPGSFGVIIMKDMVEG